MILWFVLSLALLLFVERSTFWLLRRHRRRSLRHMSINALFDAVVAGHITSDEAMEEVLRRKDWRL